MPEFAHRPRFPRSRWLGWVAGAAAMFASMVLCPNAEASKPDASSSGSNLGSTIFGTPRPSWSMAPPLRLQPEGARLMLELPREWMPAADLGLLGYTIDPNKHWEFRRSTRMTRATLGTSVHLHVSDRARSIDFGLSLLPRAAIATLRFDPLARAR
jgi:hypothetical protein